MTVVDPLAVNVRVEPLLDPPRRGFTEAEEYADATVGPGVRAASVYRVSEFVRRDREQQRGGHVGVGGVQDNESWVAIYAVVGARRDSHALLIPLLCMRKVDEVEVQRRAARIADSLGGFVCHRLLFEVARYLGPDFALQLVTQGRCLAVQGVGVVPPDTEPFQRILDERPGAGGERAARLPGYQLDWVGRPGAAFLVVCQLSV